MIFKTFLLKNGCFPTVSVKRVKASIREIAERLNGVFECDKMY